MRMMVRFQNGTRADALLLSARDRRVRVVVAGRGATEEWLVFEGHCYDEGGRPVEIEAVTAVHEASSGAKTLTAGSAGN
jgi:hypothetical protein